MVAKTAVIDASVAAKWFFEESDSDRARKLLENRYFLLAPDLIFAEVLNIFWKERRSGGRPKRRALEIIDFVMVAFGGLVPLPDLARGAADIAVELDHPIYDGFYLALADRERCMLVTADERLFHKTRKTRFASTVQLLTCFA